MPTQEERLATVERAIQESVTHMRDTDMAVTAMVGVIRSQGQDIKRLLETLEQHTELLQSHTELLKEIKALVTKEGEQP